METSAIDLGLESAWPIQPRHGILEGNGGVSAASESSEAGREAGSSLLCGFRHARPIVAAASRSLRKGWGLVMQPASCGAADRDSLPSLKTSALHNN
jgi:hypothetical protein